MPVESEIEIVTPEWPNEAELTVEERLSELEGKIAVLIAQHNAGK